MHTDSRRYIIAAAIPIACAELLIDKGASLDALTSVGETTLYMACANGNSEFVKLLLQKGADPFAGVGIPAGPDSCVRLVTAYLASWGRCAACGSYPSPSLLPPPSSLTLFLRMLPHRQGSSPDVHALPYGSILPAVVPNGRLEKTHRAVCAALCHDQDHLVDVSAKGD
jgi:hypothetical protein